VARNAGNSAWAVSSLAPNAALWSSQGRWSAVRAGQSARRRSRNRHGLSLRRLPRRRGRLPGRCRCRLALRLRAFAHPAANRSGSTLRVGHYRCSIRRRGQGTGETSSRRRQLAAHGPCGHPTWSALASRTAGTSRPAALPW